MIISDSSSSILTLDCIHAFISQMKGAMLMDLVEMERTKPWEWRP